MKPPNFLPLFSLFTFSYPAIGVSFSTSTAPSICAPRRKSAAGIFLSSVGIDSVASDSDVCISKEDTGKKLQNNHCCGMRGIPDCIWNQDGRFERFGCHLQSERRSNTENF
jgi:hypothetical protein